MSESISAQNANFREAVCIDAMRVFDSCSSQDCLEELVFSFTKEGQRAVDNAAYIKTQGIEVTDVDFSVSPVAFNQGFYSVDVTYHFRAQLEVFANGCEAPEIVYGTAVFTKKVILYGSDGGTQKFVSDGCCVSAMETPSTGCACRGMCVLPTASVSIVSPMCLDTKLTDPDTEGCRAVLITIGIFAIISLSRPVPLMVPIFDYYIPGKECLAGTSTTPCEMFGQIDFPTREFFPRGLEDERPCAANKED